MAIISLFGTSETDPAPQFKRVFITHPLEPNSLLLIPDQEGYKSTLAGWTGTQEERSARGRLRLQGGTYAPAIEWQFSVTCKDTQRQLLERLLHCQQIAKTPCTVIDRFETFVQVGTVPPVWLDGYPTFNAIGRPCGYTAWSAWVDVDEGYKTTLTDGYCLLQLQARVL